MTRAFALHPRLFRHPSPIVTPSASWLTVQQSNFSETTIPRMETLKTPVSAGFGSIKEYLLSDEALADGPSIFPARDLAWQQKQIKERIVVERGFQRGITSSERRPE